MHRFASIGQEGWLATVCLYETWHTLATLTLLGGANLKSVTETLAHLAAAGNPESGDEKA